MKKFLALIPLLVFFAACGGNNSNNNATTPVGNETTTAPAAAANDISANPDYQKGLAIVAKSGCLACHKVDSKLIGPAYKDVANKYAGSDTAVTYLSHKIIHGGSGVWGNVMMIPHPDISEADAESMVKYILLLKNQ
jgi:cytochrome c